MVIYMKILFKNKTKYTENSYKKFLEFHSNKFGFKNTFYILFMSMILFTCIILYFVNHFYLQAFLTILLLALFLVLKIIRPTLKVKKDFESDKIQKEKVFKFIFCKNYFKIYDNLKYYKIKYAKLYKIFDTNDFFYLYINDENSLLVDKKGFYYGTADEFSKFLKKNYWFKYKLIKSKN